MWSEWKKIGVHKKRNKQYGTATASVVGRDNGPLTFLMEQPSNSDWIETDELIKMMELRSPSSVEQLGGMSSIYNRLRSSPQGLNHDTLQEEFRQEKFDWYYQIESITFYYFSHHLLWIPYYHFTFFDKPDMVKMNSRSRNPNPSSNSGLKPSMIQLF